MHRLLALSTPSGSPSVRFPWQPPSCWSWIARGWASFAWTSVRKLTLLMQREVVIRAAAKRLCAAG
jgi:hypothetical protein